MGRKIDRLDSIQMLRAVAASLVVLFHAQQAFATRGADTTFVSETYLFGFGAVGVHIFFVISGFIMVVTARFKSGFHFKAFIKRRFFRVYPIYWICAATYVLMYWVMGSPYALEASQIFGAILLLPYGAPAIIGPAWTLSYEMYFYIWFGMTMVLGLNRGLLVLLIAFILMMSAGLVLQPSDPFVHLATSSLLVEFLAGAALGWLAVQGYLPLRLGAASLTLSFALFGAGLLYGYDRVPTAIVWGIPSALLVAGVVCLELRKGASTMVRWLGLLGDSSYVLYLIHILIIAIGLKAAGNWFEIEAVASLIAAFTLLPVCIITAELLHRGVERPLLRALNPRRKLVPERPDLG
ncbi:acyltransferase [Altererythrobacter sp. SALINAS58]|nr:acyltransferase [Alteripontixanthobacter muriae]